MGQIVGGIKVRQTAVVKELKAMPDDKLTDAIKSVRDGKTTLEAIKKHYSLTDEQEKAFQL